MFNKVAQLLHDLTKENQTKITMPSSNRVTTVRKTKIINQTYKY